MEKFATIKPKRVRLFGKLGDPIEATVSIQPEAKYPFQILEVTPGTEKNVRCRLEKPATEGGEYRLIIESIRETQGRFAEVIRVKTSSKVQPEMQIHVYGNILAQETPTEDASQPKTEG